MLFQSYRNYKKMLHFHKIKKRPEIFNKSLALAVTKNLNIIIFMKLNKNINKSLSLFQAINYHNNFRKSKFAYFRRRYSRLASRPESKADTRRQVLEKRIFFNPRKVRFMFR